MLSRLEGSSEDQAATPAEGQATRSADQAGLDGDAAGAAGGAAAEEGAGGEGAEGREGEPAKKRRWAKIEASDTSQNPDGGGDA